MIDDNKKICNSTTHACVQANENTTNVPELSESEVAAVAGAGRRILDDRGRARARNGEIILTGIISGDTDPIEAAYAVLGTVLPTIGEQCIVTAQITPSVTSGRWGCSESAAGAQGASGPRPIKERLPDSSSIQEIMTAKRNLTYFIR